MLYTEFQNLKVGQELFYRSQYQSPPYRFDVPKLKVKVISLNNFDVTVQVIDDPKQQDSASCSDLSFDTAETDWCQFRDFILVKVIKGGSYNVDVFRNYARLRSLCHLPQNSLFKSAKKDVDHLLALKPDPLPMQLELKSACRWWASSLRKRPKLQDGDRDLDSIAFRSWALNEIEPATEEAICLFEQRLFAEINIGLPLLLLTKVTLSVDNMGDLNGTLRSAAEGLIDEYLFRSKTTMQIKPGSVTVSCGYGAPWEEVPIN